MPVVGVDPSVDPLVYVSFNENWQPFIVGVIESLTDEDTWAGTQEEIDEAYEHVVQILSRFVDGSMLAYPQVTFAPIDLLKFQGALNPWIWSYYDSQFLNGAWYQTTPAQYDMWHFAFPHKAGTYQIQLWGMKYLNLGKTKFRVNGVYDEGSLFDWYAAAFVYNVVQTCPVMFAQDGEQTIDIVVWEKNPLSASYYVLLSSLGVF